MPKIIPVPFRGQEITATLIEGVPYIAMKPICQNIGLQWEPQRKRIQRHPVLNSTASMMEVVAEDGKRRQMLMLPISYLNGWLFGVDANRVKPAIKDRLIQYQSECYMVLANHFMDAKPKALPKPKPAITSLYQLSYIQDLRHDDRMTENVRWWSFERDYDLDGKGYSEQGRRFVEETLELARRNPQEAAEAVRWSLLYIMRGDVPRGGCYYTEIEFCSAIAHAAVAGFRADSRQSG